MKKLSGLLAVSLVAFMMAPAARADIASTEYVDKNMEAKANKVTDTKNYTGDEDSTEKYPSMAVANQMAKRAVAQNAAVKLDKAFTNNKNQVMVTDAKGTVTPTTVDTVGAGNAVTAVTVADGKYTVNKGTMFATKEQLDTVQTTADNTASAVNNATTGLATKAAKKYVDDELAKKQNTLKQGTNITIGEDGTISATYEYNDSALAGRVTTLENTGVTKDRIDAIATNTANIAKKQDKLVASGENANIAGSDGVSVSIGSNGKITVAGNQAAINTALAGKQDKLGTDQLNAVNSNITADKVKTYAGYADKITAAKNQADKGVADAAAAQTTANAAVVANKAITAGTGTKITYDAKGLVTGSTSLAASDIPTLTTGKISGLDTALAAKFVAPGTSVTSTDGTYTLTMKVADGKPTYAWEKIGRGE